MQIRPYAMEQAATLLGRVAFRVNRAAKVSDPASIQELRVAIHRFGQCLRLFRAFFPARARGKSRRDLRRVLLLAEKVRHRDAALELCHQASLPADAALVVRLRKQRQESMQDLAAQLARLRNAEFSRRWRKKLQLQVDG